MTRGAVHRYPSIYLTAKENPGKFQLGDRLIKAVRPVMAPNAVPFFQMKYVGSHNRSDGRGMYGLRVSVSFSLYSVPCCFEGGPCSLKQTNPTFPTGNNFFKIYSNVAPSFTPIHS